MHTQRLTNTGENLVQQIATRYGLSREAVLHMLVAVNNGNGSMAQFNCPELGGSGQWMRGGMTMVGDMFNYGLKATVDSLCLELSDMLANYQIFPVVPAGTPGSNSWWPADLGQPLSSGAQNNIRYAVFPGRLAVERHGQISVYDTLNHQIGGVSQQQGGDTSLTFSSQFGTVTVNSLPLISGPGMAPSQQTNFANPPAEQAPEFVQQAESQHPAARSGGGDVNATLDLLAKLAQLRDAGALTEDEFNSKKKELLSRI